MPIQHEALKRHRHPGKLDNLSNVQLLDLWWNSYPNNMSQNMLHIREVQSLTCRNMAR